MLQVVKHMLPFTRYPYRGDETPCPVCGSDDLVKVASVDRRLKRLPTVMCGHCGLLYTNPVPTEEELAHYYEKFYRLDYQFVVTKPKARERRKRLAEASERVAILSPECPPGSRILDVGCGTGEFVELMAKEGHDAHGLEPGETYGRDARSRLGDRVTIATWNNARFQRAFDLVASFQVVEHLADPLGAIAAMASWTKPGGKVFIDVPDMCGGIDKGFGSFHFAHVVGFNRHNLCLAAARCGLVPEREVRPTSILFRFGEPGELAELAHAGANLSRRRHIEKSPVRGYVSYQLSKLRR